MLTHLKKGILVWILGFLTFLAAVNVLNAVMHGVDKGAEDSIGLYLIGSVVPDIKLRDYFWISVAATCILSALTSIVAFRTLSDPHLLWRIDKLEEGMANNADTIRVTHMNLVEDIENSRKAREEFMNKITTNLRDTRKEILSMLNKNEKHMQEIEENFQEPVREMMSTLEKYGESIQQISTSIESVTKETRKTLKDTMKNQIAHIEKMTKRVAKLEEKLLPQPIITSRNKPEDIRGVGPRLGEELRALGITTVADLVTTDSRTIAEKTRASRDTIEHLQTTAQLLMIPSISEKHVELLEETGVTTRKELASQEPIQLSQKLEAITKTYLEQGKLSESEKPTIEEIVSWIRHAKI